MATTAAETTTAAAEEDTSDLPEILPFDGDAYHGVQIDVAALFPSDDTEESETNKKVDPAAFGRRLRSSLEHWRAAGRRGVWLKLPLPQASLLFTVAVEEGFFKAEGVIEDKAITAATVTDQSFAQKVVAELGPYKPAGAR